MTSLQEVQAALVTRLREGGERPHARALDFIRDNGLISPELAIAIYTNNTVGAPINALAAAYPASLRIVGEDCFRGLAKQFICVATESSRDLNLFGESFPAFLESWINGRRAFSDFSYLPDLARLEWLMHRAYYADDEPGFDFDAFRKASSKAPETLRLVPAKSLGVLRSVYPLKQIRELNLGAGNAAMVQDTGAPQCLVVSRKALRCEINTVDYQTFVVLTACCAGTPLADIARTLDDDTHRIPQIIERSIRQEWLTGFAFGEDAGAENA